MRWATAIAFGAVVCTALDHQHVTHDVLSYPRPAFWSEAWWVPCLFGAATLAAVGLVEPLRRLLRGRFVVPSTGRLLLDLAVFAAAYDLTAIGQASPTVVTVVLVLAWLARVVAGLPAWVVVVSLLTAVVGPAFEAGWSALGFFHYHHPDVIGVARWLPALYLHVGVAAVSVSAAVRAGPAPVTAAA